MSWDTTPASYRRAPHGPCSVCVCIFLTLHITAQSGPVILLILCHSHSPSQGGSMSVYLEVLTSKHDYRRHRDRTATVPVVALVT